MVVGGANIGDADVQSMGVRVPEVVGVIFGGKASDFGADNAVAGGGVSGVLGGALIFVGVVIMAVAPAVHRKRHKSRIHGRSKTV